MASRRIPEPLTPSRTPKLVTAPVPPAPRKSSPAPAVISGETRHAMIAESAYLRAEQRGFAPGRETEDWLAAEAEVDALLRGSRRGAPQ
ncbi:MAG: DUF2934 domain-containing protein [Gammaproteobacteria bacterium]|nr:DUF2934 domain-containing protein [Gammaproteobacteria bacterium]MBV9697945.1 DUF2934 domain-containing protein [Gammaproteobacteria bacterium]